MKKSAAKSLQRCTNRAFKSVEGLIYLQPQARNTTGFSNLGGLWPLNC